MTLTRSGDPGGPVQSALRGDGSSGAFISDSTNAASEKSELRHRQNVAGNGFGATRRRRPGAARELTFLLGLRSIVATCSHCRHGTVSASESGRIIDTYAGNEIKDGRRFGENATNASLFEPFALAWTRWAILPFRRRHDSGNQFGIRESALPASIRWCRSPG
jgi:hypothetical protein